jgi:hypothetical protein
MWHLSSSRDVVKTGTLFQSFVNNEEIHFFSLLQVCYVGCCVSLLAPWTSADEAEIRRHSWH